MNELSLSELQQIIAANGKLDGWDFSHLKVEGSPKMWDYVEVVKKYLKPTDKVLDVGTGGGEIFSRLAPFFAEGVAIDQQQVMVETAKRNFDDGNVANVSISHMEASDLKFAAESFDVVLVKHLHIYIEENVRVLKPGGIFITQTVGPNSSIKMLDAFDWTPASFGPDWWQTVDEVAEELEGHGFKILGKAELDVPCWFQDVASALFFLMSVPWPEKIVVEKHWRNINRYLKSARTEKGFENNEHNGLLIAQKPW